MRELTQLGALLKGWHQEPTPQRPKLTIPVGKHLTPWQTLVAEERASKQTKQQRIHLPEHKTDEFYTQLWDIEEELKHYTQHFAGKVVYCNCDYAPQSNFFRYFATRFHELGLARLIATNYYHTATPCLFEYNGSKLWGTYLRGTGDFASPECQLLLESADIVVSNPPFRAFTPYIETIANHNKDFLVIGNLTAAKNNLVFNLIKNNLAWLGVSTSGMLFEVEEDYRGAHWIAEDGKHYAAISAVWFTTLPHHQRKVRLPTPNIYTPEEYPKFDNYDAISVKWVAGIPGDYDGKMGVPVSYLLHHNPDQFEIVGRAVDVNNRQEFKLGGKELYTRIVIRRK